jgi:flagellar biosynthesis anti-sigma factor FlgM
MRIDPFNSTAASQVSSEPGSTQAAQSSTARSGHADPADRTTLTADSASVGSLASLALNSPAVRQDKVESLRLSVNSGQYEIDPAKIASAIIDEYA